MAAKPLNNLCPISCYFPHYSNHPDLLLFFERARQAHTSGPLTSSVSAQKTLLQVFAWLTPKLLQMSAQMYLPWKTASSPTRILHIPLSYFIVFYIFHCHLICHVFNLVFIRIFLPCRALSSTRAGFFSCFFHFCIPNTYKSEWHQVGIQ